MSRSFRNIISILSIVRGSVVLLEDYYKETGPVPRVVSRLVARVNGAVEEALDLWPGEISGREVRGIGGKFGVIERSLVGDFSGKRNAYMNLCLGLLSDAMEQVRDPEKLGALESVNHHLLQLYKRFDHRLTRVDAMEAATQACVLWYRLSA